MTLFKKQCFFTQRQHEYIKAYAEKWQVTEAEAIRRLLDDKIDADPTERIVYDCRPTANI